MLSSPSCGAVGPLSSPPCSPHTLFVGYLPSPLTPPSLLPSHPTCRVSPCLSSHPSCRVSPFSLLSSPQLWGCRNPQPSSLLPSPQLWGCGTPHPSLLPSHPISRDLHASPHTQFVGCLPAPLTPLVGYPHAPLIPAVGLWDPSPLPPCSPHTPFVGYPHASPHTPAVGCLPSPLTPAIGLWDPSALLLAPLTPHL